MFSATEREIFKLVFCLRYILGGRERREKGQGGPREEARRG